jgi:multidrug efflux system outer membrane protein
MNRSSLAALAAVSLVLGLAACSPGPAYHRPEIATAPQWRDEAAPDSTSFADLQWWQIYNDPVLVDLINTALVENTDLNIAAERVVEAAARLGFTKSDLWPQIDLSATAMRFQDSRNSFPPNPEPGQNLATVYDLSVPVTWELDLFGRIRSASAAARAELLATEAGQQAVAISLVAQVASSYATLRAVDLQLEISRRTLESRREYIDLARVRFEGGITSETDWRQAEAEYHRIQATVQDFERLQRQVENAISVLIGRYPGEILRGRPLPDLPVFDNLPAGLPSDLIERRPDVRQAEQFLIAANADIGQAKALMFPRLALTGDLGVQSTDLETLFDAPSKAFSIVGNLLQPLFQGGKNRQRVKVSESVMRQNLYVYEATVLNAFREVEDSLIAFRKLSEQREAQRARVEAERKVVDLVELAYGGGVKDYLYVLDAQRSLFTAELDEVRTMNDQIDSLIQLYKALGGGWPTAPAAADTTTTN